MRKNIRINVTGRITPDSAETLGGWVEEDDGGSVLVAPYVDQAQFSGLLVQLSDLHLTFDHVAVEPAALMTDQHHDINHTPRSHPMTTTMNHSTESAVVRTKRLGLAAVATTMIAVLAGLCMLVLDPTAGSSTEAVLGITAAVAGLTTAALVVGAVIYASFNGLWDRLSVNWRYAVWVLLAVGIARTIWSQVSNLA